MEKTSGKSGLKKVLSFPMVVLIIINMVIGSGVFFKAQGVFTITKGTPGIGLAAWVAAGIISLLGGLTVAELAGAIPKTGGMVSWIEEIFGKQLGYLVGWVEAIVFWPANIGALGAVFAVQLVNLMGLPESHLGIVSAAAILFLVVMNCLGAKVGGWIGTIFTVAKMIPLIFIIILAFTYEGANPQNVVPLLPSEGNAVSIFGAAVLSCMYSYDGWMHVGNVAGEMKNPAKDLPKAIVFGLSAVVVIYAVISVVMALSGSYNTLTDMCMFTIWIFYSLTFLGVLKYRKDRPDIVRTYRVPGYPVIPVLAFAGGAFVVLMTLVTQTMLAVVGLGLTLLGLIVYHFRKDKIEDISVVE